MGGLDDQIFNAFDRYPCRSGRMLEFVRQVLAQSRIAHDVAGWTNSVRPGRSLLPHPRCAPHSSAPTPAESRRSGAWPRQSHDPTARRRYRALRDPPHGRAEHQLCTRSSAANVVVEMGAAFVGATQDRALGRLNPHPQLIQHDPRTFSVHCGPCRGCRSTDPAWAYTTGWSSKASPCPEDCRGRWAGPGVPKGAAGAGDVRRYSLFVLLERRDVPNKLETPV
jgi:hypothetical protein